MATIEKYPTYKDSGVEWLGEIPEHWELTRLGTRFIERRTKVSDKDYEPLSVTKQGILHQLDNAAKSNDGDNRKLVKAGDFVINSRSDRKGSSGIAKIDGSVSLINIVIEPQSVNPSYCNYLLKSYVFVEEFYRMGHGIVADLWTTRYDEMKGIKIAIPPLKEQTAIASFIDQKTVKIDQAIAQKVKLIELLKERRQILIHHAVTKGLNDDRLNGDENNLNYDFDDDLNTLITKPSQSNQSPSQNSLNGDENNLNYDFDDDLNTMITKPNQSNQSLSQNQKKSKFRPSGVEWIGEIPEHWEVKRLKYFVNIQGGFAFNSNDFKEAGVQIIKIANTYMNELCLDRQPTFVDRSFLISHKEWAVKRGDILMSLTGTLGKKDYGFAILIDNEDVFLLNQRVAKISVKTGFEADYILNILQSEMYLNQLYLLPSGTKQANLSNDNVINIKVPFPPNMKERSTIISHIISVKTKIATAISLKEKEIEKLKEYKATLINSAVTGKIKVSHDA